MPREEGKRLEEEHKKAAQAEMKPRFTRSKATRRPSRREAKAASQQDAGGR